MDEILDQLNQVIESRVAEIRNGIEREKNPAYQKEIKEHTEHMDRILLMLPEDERKWLDACLVERLAIPEQERLRYYKTGFSGAIGLLQFFRT